MAGSFEKLLLDILDDPIKLMGAVVGAVCLLALMVFSRGIFFYLRLMFLNLRRNLVRTGLTSVASMLLVFVVTLVWTILWFLNIVTSEKSKDFKAIVSEKWQIPSQMPFAYQANLSEGAYSKEGDYKIDTTKDSMTWQFYGATIDPEKRTRGKYYFLFWDGTSQSHQNARRHGGIQQGTVGGAREIMCRNGER